MSIIIIIVVATNTTLEMILHIYKTILLENLSKLTYSKWMWTKVAKCTPQAAPPPPPPPSKQVK